MAKEQVSYDEIVKKYQQMVRVRKEGGDIDINDYLPSIYDMLKEDCVWDVLNNMQNEWGDSNDKAEDVAYYVEKPPITTPGYYEEEQCFVLHSNGFPDVKDYDWQLGNLDGDTWYFDMDDLDVGDPFTINGKIYNSFKEYAMANNINCKKLTIRSAGIDTAEICHYQAIKLKDRSLLKTFTYDEARLKGYAIRPYKIDMKGSPDNPGKWKLSKYKDNEKITFYGSEGSYVQVVDDLTKLPEDTNIALVANGVLDWGSETILDGYKAQKRVREIITNKNVKEVITIVDRNMVVGKKIDRENMYYNSFLFTFKNIETLYYDLKRDIMDFSLATAEYMPFGCDNYGRVLGNSWALIGTEDGDVWINLSKYVMAGTNFTENNPTFYNTEMTEIYGGISSAFKQWNNTSNEFRYVDSLSASGINSYNDRIKLHKKLTGIDFSIARDHTVLLGDTLFMIPPEAIHTSSTLDYEKLPILRGKGSMMKNRTNIEELLELELYFNNEYGINGIPYETTTPSGDKITYFMNGLRALIAQFRVAPFLPIENHYINDVLNIEAVSLVNISVSTVEGFPKLLKVVLTLRDFNYRVFMPDLPLPEYDMESEKISEMDHIFAKCFDWELFRYYYQRGILNGEQSNRYKYNTKGYNDFIYSNKNVYKHTDLKESEFELYVPDATWLKYALQVKKARDTYGQVDMDSLEDDPNASLSSNSSKNSLVAIINDNKPYFKKEELGTMPYEKYGELDSLGRCTEAFAILHSSMMPTEDRGDISSVTPTGWNNKKYPSLESENNDSGYLYNRCHLIGYALTGQNANKKNLITGTVYMNSGLGLDHEDDKDNGGMWYYEKKTKEYLENHPDNHVAYRVTPIFDGSNLLASAVQMEAYSIEDEGKGLSFNVYIRNFQPGITIDYRTGENEISDEVQKNEIIYNYYDYKDPRNMKFVPYLQDENGNSVAIEIDSLSFNMGNYFTETHLKAVDGYAPQFMGGSDVNIELKLTLTSEYYIGALKNLPHTIMDMIRNYRRVMPCFPLKIKNEYLQMININEVVFDNIAVSTKPGHPGVFDVTIKLTSMDRSMRQREALRKADLEGNETSSSSANAIGNYFNLQESLAAAELYPDLDLPTIAELKELGWRFAKWANDDRIYVDPDFYICYSFQYASKLVKEIVNNVLNQVSYKAGKEESMAVSNNIEISKEIEAKRDKAYELNKIRLVDSSNMGADISGGIDYDGVNMDDQYGFSKLYDETMIKVQSHADADTDTKKSGAKTPTKDQSKAVISAIQYLTASGIEHGWQVAPGWYAPLCDTYVNDELEKYKYSGVVQTAKLDEENSQYVAEIYNLRHRAITLIDKVLSRPLSSSKDATNDPLRCVTDAVNNVFRDTSEGKQLLKLLCPMMDKSEIGTENKGEASSIDVLKLKSEYFAKADPIQWIQGFLYSLACTRSGAEPYSDTKKSENWQPRQWQSKTYPTTDSSAIKAGLSGDKIPYNKIENNNNAGDNMLADTYDQWRDHGVSFGAGQITRYPAKQIKSMLQPESKIKYFNTGSLYYNNMYYKTKKAKRDRFCETGFIDPYYNYAGYKSKEGKDYIERISTCQTANYEALLREVLVYLKRLIMDGYIFNEVDVIAKDWDSVLAEINKVASSTTLEKTIIGTHNEFVNDFANKQLIAEQEGIDLAEEQQDADIAKRLKEEIPKSYNKLFCARWIYPFALAACNGNKNILKLFKERDYATLATYTLSSSVGGSNETLFNRYLVSMFGVGMIGSCNVMDSAETTSNTQKAFNTLMNEAFTALANDPRCYALHSMYDMCVTDKRGRLLRAFPCYYILFVDEGRQIGTWRLFDNFYNMSSISNLQVVKSRKMPADTCTFTMSNMFMSYADTYDNTIYNQYVDVYGFKDVFSSIFSPRGYVSKEDMIRQRKQLTDTTPLTPGVRIHVRMGYGSDGSRLPIVFNGKIAEIECGETVEIIAQGDGHELNNPLNTLGELTARNFEESQGWFTMFKDVRGSLARGGETPRNLLAKLATAQYGGAFKTIVREYTKGRFFYDNPFGMYHFGDRRFRDIFDDSEIVQNMYEVSNKTILNGTNDLLSDISTFNAAPVINCNIQDKTMWEIGHLCANSGDDYFFAVRDFGLRSTMCLCKANHYYAYEYQLAGTKDEVILEKRKPFQQFHYYDSYNDIIYNALKASESNMKTNAVGTWEGTDYLWGTGQQSVGPIYLDMNIYPEYQKSMMVDTGLIAGGDGGINIPLFNALAEKFNYDEYAGRVNKSLAEKVTTNVLRQSVKDMYEGEICIIGDTSLKPYDRVSLVDLYEDMSGNIEVETVIHSMNIETGFTTTFVPDVIIRAENSCQECGYQSVMSSIILGLTGSITFKNATMSMAKKGCSGLVKLGSKPIMSKIGASVVKKGTASTVMQALTSGLSAGSSASTSGGMLAILSNPIALTTLAASAAGIFMLTQNYKEMFTRFCRNIQALTVFPITKNGRLLIAGMAGHKGSVYGYKYTDSASKNSIQYYIMNFLEGSTDNTAINVVGHIFSAVLTDDNYNTVKNKWISNLGLNQSNDIIDGNGASDIRNQEAFYQSLSNSISKEYTSRAASLAAMKTKPRITSFNTSNRTSDVYLKYQIGGIYDKDEFKGTSNAKALTVADLSTNERIKHLIPLEDDPEIKLALNSDVHPVIKKFVFYHSSSPLTFELKMENENTIIRYYAEGDNQKIFDLPMLQEDAVNIIKLIINSDNMKGKTVTFTSGTRVNSTASWKSTGFAFSLSCDDMAALEAASLEIKKSSSWISSKPSFAYKRTAKSIQYTVYAPLNIASNTLYDSVGDEDE